MSKRKAPSSDNNPNHDFSEFLVGKFSSIILGSSMYNLCKSLSLIGKNIMIQFSKEVLLQLGEFIWVTSSPIIHSMSVIINKQNTINRLLGLCKTIFVTVLGIVMGKHIGTVRVVVT